MKRSLVFLGHSMLGLLLYAIAYLTAAAFLRLAAQQSGFSIATVPMELAGHFLVMIAVPFYTFYFLWPHLIQNRNRLFWYLAAIIFLFLGPLLFLMLDHQLITLSSYFSVFVFACFFALLGGLFSSFFQWWEQKQRQENLAKQQVRSELDLLRIQINSHFLFNTLHNIDTLIKHEPDTASHLLLQLAGMMRYMLYESQASQVLLSQEIAYIQQYIALQRLRFTDENKVTFALKGEAAGNKAIAPMLLIPFIENAFKHYQKAGPDDGINIALEINGNQLDLRCANSYQPADTNKDQASGIGLRTVKRRLALIYPNKYTLEIKDTRTIFDVQLTVAINEN